MSRAAVKLTPHPSSLAQQEADFTAEGAPAPGRAGTPAGGGTTADLSTVAMLEATLAAETSRRQQLEREVSIVRSALERARVDLAGTRAGERHARHLALHDGLTSLPNRRHFQQRLEEALARASPQHPALGVLYLDLDDFKPINDRYGHDAGDEILRIVAARLARAVRSEDLMSRLGGDEFACLPVDFVDLEQLAQLAEKLYETVSAPLKFDRFILTVRPSIGIATWPADGRTAGALLKSADAAMYRAKRQQTGYAFRESRTGVHPGTHPGAGVRWPRLTRDRANGSAG